jgi:hypothetical protein
VVQHPGPALLPFLAALSAKRKPRDLLAELFSPGDSPISDFELVIFFPLAVIQPQERAVAAATRGLPYVDQRFSELVNELVIVVGCWRDAQPLGAARSDS